MAAPPTVHHPNSRCCAHPLRSNAMPATAGNRNPEIRDRMFMSPPTMAICGVDECVGASRHLRSTNGVNLVQRDVGTISRGLIECDVNRSECRVVNNPGAARW